MNELDIVNNFVNSNNILQKGIVILGLAGSRAYGTSIDNDKYHSDYDYRGICLNPPEEIIGIEKDFEQFSDSKTDTVIYSFKKIIQLLSNCNPNVIEILGLKPEHYLYLSDVGHEMILNTEMFLSKKAIFTFGSYANSQLRRLSNKAVRQVGQEEREQHILNSINGARYDFQQKYFYHDADAINLYIDKAVNPEMETEIFMDVNLIHYPLRDYKCMWSEMNNIIKDYAKLGKRNQHAVEHNKLGKHMMHLVRLYYMCFDILEKHEINTYRTADHDLLMSIRNGKYLNENDQPIPEFFEMVDELEKRLDYDKANTDLPEKPDYKRINEFVMDVNERVVKGEV